MKMDKLLLRFCQRPRFLQSLLKPAVSVSTYSSTSSVAKDSKFKQYLSDLLGDYHRLNAQAMTSKLDGNSRRKLLQITEAAKLCEEVKKSESDVEEINLAMEMEEDESMKKLMRDEKKALLESQQQLYSDIINYCVPALETDELTDFLLEVHAGVGGVEAGLFTYDLYCMYERLCMSQGWRYSVTHLQEMESTSSSKSINKVQLQISGHQAYKLLKFESGIHRVQRVPATERSGRMHTSTSVVVVLPKPQNIHIEIDKKDLKIDVFRSRGGGGQSVNTTDSAVRITHLPTGTVVECQQDRSQIKNKKLALEELKSRLYGKQLSEQQANTSHMRRLQIGGANRNEKIRTYNYPQDRVTDHRVKVTLAGVSSLLAGDSVLVDFLYKLAELDKHDRLVQWLNELQLQHQPS